MKLINFKFSGQALAGVAQLVGVSSPKLKGHGFDTWSGHMPRLWVLAQVRVCTRGNGTMFLSCVVVSLLSFSLLSPCSKINKHVLG